MIIGLTGKNGSGKGVVAEYLKSKGFGYYSLSDILREELSASGQPVTRENLIQKGQELRKKFGPGVLAEKTLDKIDPSKNYIVDSFRHPAEAAVFKREKSFMLWCVDADARVRFERCLARARENEPKTFDEFLKTEKKEFNTGDKTKQDLLQTIQLADITLQNDSSKENLYEKIEALFKRAIPAKA